MKTVLALLLVAYPVSAQVADPTSYVYLSYATDYGADAVNSTHFNADCYYAYDLDVAIYGYYVNPSAVASSGSCPAPNSNCPMPNNPSCPCPSTSPPNYCPCPN